MSIACYCNSQRYNLLYRQTGMSKAGNIKTVINRFIQTEVLQSDYQFSSKLQRGLTGIGKWQLKNHNTCKIKGRATRFTTGGGQD
jgi:hypothetical protein